MKAKKKVSKKGKLKAGPINVALHPAYYKVGDDWDHELEKAGGDPVEALESWAASLERSAKGLLALARILKAQPSKLSGHGAAHDATLFGLTEKAWEAVQLDEAAESVLVGQ